MCPFGGLYCLILDGGWTRCTSGLIFHGFPGRRGGGALPDSEHPHPARKHNTFNQCWHNVGPASQTVGQRYPSIGLSILSPPVLASAPYSPTSPGSALTTGVTHSPRIPLNPWLHPDLKCPHQPTRDDWLNLPQAPQSFPILPTHWVQIFFLLESFLILNSLNSVSICSNASSVHSCLFYTIENSSMQQKRA